MKPEKLPTYEETMKIPSPPSYRTAMYDDFFPPVNQITQAISQEEILEGPPAPPNNPNFVGFLRPPSSRSMNVVYPLESAIFFGEPPGPSSRFYRPNAPAAATPSAPPAPSEPPAATPSAPPAPVQTNRRNRLRRMFNLE